MRRVDRRLRLIIDHVGPCRLSSDGKKFESLCRSIVSQQLSNAAAKSIWARLSLHLTGGLSPTAIMAANPRALRRCGLSMRKVRFIRGLAEKVVSRELRFDFSNKTDFVKIARILKTVKGIGNWTAEMFAIFSLNHPDIFPADDAAIQRAFRQVYSLEFPDDNKRINQIASRWRPWRSVGAWYLWKHLDGGQSTQGRP